MTRARLPEVVAGSASLGPPMTGAVKLRLTVAVCVGMTCSLGLGACGTSSAPPPAADPLASALPHAHPQAIEPVAGQTGASGSGTDGSGNFIGDPSAHAPPLSQVEQELRQEVVFAAVNGAQYIDPLRYVTLWERTDQGVDANMPVGAPIVAPCPVKILDVLPDWYRGQPLVYFELLDGPDAGRVQYVAEEITSIARPGSYLAQGQAIARYAPSGTGIEYGWSTLNGVTLAVATTGYEEGQKTPAGRSIRAWLNALGANAGSD